VSEVRPEVEHAVGEGRAVRLGGLLDALGVPRSSWYRQAVPAEQRKPPGPAPKPIPDDVIHWVVRMAVDNPWYGYKRIAVMCLFELLPSGPNELWQMDVTYVHIPGYGWRYAITVIDYYSRYLLACYLTWSYSAAQAERALSLARERAERLCGPLGKRPFLVTDNGPTFVARRFGAFLKDGFAHVRIAYRTPTQLGLLERFHRTLKEEELYWRLYDSPEHCRSCLAEFRDRYNRLRPHWALVPEAGGDPVTPEDVYVGGVRVRIPKWQAWARAAKAKLDEMMERVA
jgi:transposase InsO family protein